MAYLVWTPELENQHPQMDQTHREFVELMGQVEAALGGEQVQLLERFDALHQHTVSHFEQEDRWMADTGFAPDNCHSSQHRQVLDLLKEVRRLVVDENQQDLIGRLLPELATWFEQHAQAADSALAFHMSQVGYDAATRRSERPVEAEEAISGCGSSSC